MAGHDDLDPFLEEAKARQRNIVFPDTVRNGRAVDVFLWRGSPNPTLVQRIAAWMFGVALIISGLLFLSMLPQTADRDRDGPWIASQPWIVWLGYGLTLVFAFVFISVGARLIRNGFPRPTQPKTPV